MGRKMHESRDRATCQASKSGHLVLFDLNTGKEAVTHTVEVQEPVDTIPVR